MNDQNNPTANADHFLQLLRKKNRGRLKIYVGMSAGVGKTFRMLQEAQALQNSGVDVVLGFIETHGRAETVAQLKNLPQLSQREVYYKGKALKEFDLQAALNRRPEVIVVDELAHTNIPGSKNEKRWQDVEALLDAGISVISAVNIQHLESLNQPVQRITSIEVTERIPDRIVQEADEVVNIDLSAPDLIKRLTEGKIYTAEKIEQALQNFFKEDTLLQLRELALREVAKQVDRQIEESIPTRPGLKPPRMALFISTNHVNARKMIRKVARMAGEQAEWFVVYIQTPDESVNQIKLSIQRQLMANLDLANELGARVEIIKAKEVVSAVYNFAIERKITLLVFGRTHRKWWLRVFKPGPVEELIAKTKKMPLDILILSPDEFEV